MKNIMAFKHCRHSATLKPRCANKALQLTSNTPLRFVLRSTELKRYVYKRLKIHTYG